MKLETFKKYRLESNTVEKRLVDSFVKNHTSDTDMSLIVFGSDDSNSTRPADFLSDREKQIVLSTIQWLGSPVGQYFLYENGFEKPKPTEDTNVVSAKMCVERKLALTFLIYAGAIGLGFGVAFLFGLI